jgi:hypothetical protein
MVAAMAAAAMAQPNLVVRIDGVVQSNNDEVTFPNTVVGESTRIVVVLRNQGNEDLLFSENPPVFVGGGFDGYFGLIQPALESGNKLSPNGSTAFAVDFKPGHRAQRLSTRVFVFTNASAAPFALDLAGRSLGPKMVVKLDGAVINDLGLIEFPETLIGETSELDFTIENQGDADLVLTNDPLVQIFGGFDFDFAVTVQPDAVIPGGGASDLTVAFTPTLERLYTTRMFIHNNAGLTPAQDIFDVDIEALATAPVEEPVVEEPTAEEPTVEDPQNEEPVEEENNGQIEENVEDENIGQDPIQDEIEQLEGEIEQLEEEMNNGQIDQNGQNGDIVNDGNKQDDELGRDELTDEELELLTPVGGMCGFGAFPMMLVGLVSLCGARAGGRRRSM